MLLWYIPFNLPTFLMNSRKYEYICRNQKGILIITALCSNLNTKEIEYGRNYVWIEDVFITGTNNHKNTYTIKNCDCFIHIRSPSCMAISSSYVRQTFDFCEKKGFIPTFFILFKKTQLLVLCIYFLGSLLIRRNFTTQSSSYPISDASQSD